MVAGIFLHLYAARLAYAAGSLAKAYTGVVLAIIWLIWAAFFFNRKFVFYYFKQCYLPKKRFKNLSAQAY